MVTQTAPVEQSGSCLPGSSASTCLRAALTLGKEDKTVTGLVLGMTTGSGDARKWRRQEVATPGEVAPARLLLAPPELLPIPQRSHTGNVCFCLRNSTGTSRVGSGRRRPTRLRRLADSFLSSPLCRVTKCFICHSCRVTKVETFLLIWCLLRRKIGSTSGSRGEVSPCPSCQFLPPIN